MMSENHFFSIILFSSDFISSVERRGCLEDGRSSSHMIQQDTGEKVPLLCENGVLVQPGNLPLRLREAPVAAVGH